MLPLPHNSTSGNLCKFSDIQQEHQKASPMITREKSIQQTEEVNTEIINIKQAKEVQEISNIK
jgi:hypothetical protein